MNQAKTLLIRRLNSMEASDIILFSTIAILILQIYVNKEQSKINESVLEFMHGINKELDEIQKKNS